MCELLEFFTQSELDNTSSAGDAEESERESKSYICLRPFCTVGHIAFVTNSQSMV